MSIVSFNSPIKLPGLSSQTRIVTMAVNDPLGTVSSAGYLNSQVDVNGNPILVQVNGVNLNQFSNGGNGLVLNSGDFINMAYLGGQGIFQISVGAGNIITLSNSIASLSTQIAMTAAQWNAMYGAPFLMIPAAGANTIVVPNSMFAKLLYGSAQFAAGGPVALQWGNTVNGGGVLATNAEQASDFTGATASTLFMFDRAFGNGSQAAYSSCVNTGLYLSNSSAAFTTGTGASWLIDINYTVLSSNS